MRADQIIILQYIKEYLQKEVIDNNNIKNKVIVIKESKKKPIVHLVHLQSLISVILKNKILSHRLEYLKPLLNYVVRMVNGVFQLAREEGLKLNQTEKDIMIKITVTTYFDTLKGITDEIGENERIVPSEDGFIKIKVNL